MDTTETPASIAGQVTAVQSRDSDDDGRGPETSVVARRALAAVPCGCPDAYYGRGLVAPECQHHDLADDLHQWVMCVCTGCRRLREFAP